jgi:hypothetical protein
MKIINPLWAAATAAVVATSLIQHVGGRLVGSQTVAQLGSKTAAERGLKHKKKNEFHSEKPVKGTKEHKDHYRHRHHYEISTEEVPGSQIPQQADFFEQLGSKAAPKRGLKHKPKNASQQNQQDHHLRREKPIKGTKEHKEHYRHRHHYEISTEEVPGSQIPQQVADFFEPLGSKAAPKRGLKHKKENASRQSQRDHHLHSEKPVKGKNENTEEAHSQHHHRTDNDNAKETVHHQHHDNHHKHHKEHTKQYKNAGSMGSGRHHENSNPSSALECSCQSQWGEAACDKWAYGPTIVSWEEEACARDCCISLYMQHEEETFAKELELEGVQDLNDVTETIMHHYEVVAR